MDFLRLCRHEHTFAAFIDVKKAFDSRWVEATLVRLFDFGVLGRLWHLLGIFLCGTLSQVRLGGWHCARQNSFSPSFQPACRQSRRHSSFSHSSGVPLVASDHFRHACQLHADDLVILTASQADLQVALDAVYAWAFAGVSLLVLAIPSLPLWSLVLCAVALTVVYVLAAFPCLRSSSTGTWMLFSLPPFLGALTSILSVVLAEMVSFTRPVLGALVKVSLSPFRRLFSSPVFSGARPLVLSSLVMILLPFSNSTSHSIAGVAIVLGGPALPLLLRYTSTNFQYSSSAV